MAPHLKLPDNFCVRTFGSSWNNNGIGKYVMPPARFGADAIIPTPGVAREDGQEEIMHVSETRLSDSLSRPVPRDCPTSEPSVGSEEQQDRGLEVASGGSDALKKRKRASTAPTRKRPRTAPKTVTRRWQEVWSCKFTWAEGEFNANGELTRVVCQSCTAITGHKKMMVRKGDNLEKHEGKRSCKEDS
jgi:hypothetical protein